MSKTKKNKKYRNKSTLKRIKNISLKSIKRIGGNPVNTFHFYNRYRYGDNILNLKFLYNISNILKKNNILIHYYYDTERCKKIEELQAYVNTDVVILHPLIEKPESAIELWMNNPIDSTRHYDIFDLYYNKFYTQILKYLNLDPIKLNIDTSVYQNEPYLQKIYDKLNQKYKDIDILILSCEPASGQYKYNKEIMDKVCIELSKKYKIVTTCHVSDSIPSTINDNLKMQDIGAISTHAKYIVSANSGPFVACLNIKAKNSVKHWFILDTHLFILDTHLFKFNEIPYTSITDLNTLVEEINKVNV